MRNAWAIRAYPSGVSKLSEFQSESIIAIGWSGTGELTGKSREEIKKILELPPFHLTSLYLGRAYGTVNTFVNQISAGDFVLVPNGDDIFFAKVTSDYYFNSAARLDDYAHQRKVEWLNRISRVDLPMEIRQRLKQPTITKLTPYFNLINGLITGTTNIPSKKATIAVSYPLRESFDVKFNIPNDMTQVEAERLSNHIKTLYFIQ